jgi:hypothetical protein
MLPIVVFTSALVSNFLSMFLEPMSARSVVGVGTSTLKKNGDTIDVYIPGAGFSGFFYTLGRLQALHQSSYHNSSSFQYYCFSAGCLALLTSLLQLPVDSAVKLAHSSRNRWILGEISRYDVVEHFVDGLLDVEDVDVDAPIPTEGIWNATIEQDVECRDFQCNSTQGGRVIENEQFAVKRDEIDIRDFFPRINVITSTWDAQHFISQQVQQPSSVEHLKELLIQTTWIPFVTGSSFWKREGDNFHNDGAFAGLFKRQQFFYPGQYHHSLLLPWSVDLLSNGLNILLGHDRAVHYWEEGYSRGVNAS